MSDKRTVATDALATLGTIIDDKQKRDAIHLAVEPVVAGERMEAGDHITVKDGVAWRADPGDFIAGDDPLGIVDPFLRVAVKRGERFWFVMYPGKVHSLRHVWSHPAFRDEAGTPADVADDVPAGVVTARKTQSEKWLRQFCASSDCPSYEEVMGVIVGGNRGTWDDEYLHFSGRDAHGEIPPEFWTHVEVVLGRKVDSKPTSFSCSC